MEGNFRLETAPAAADIGCVDELIRSNSDASTLTADIFEDVLHYSENVKLDDSRTWTNEKHSLYLELLEASFVKKLHQSMGLLAQCSEQNKRDKNISPIQPINVHNGSEQYRCSQKINYEKGEPLSIVSDDSRNPRDIQCVYRSKCSGIHCASPSADIPEAFELSGTENYWKEGSGQNFVEEDILTTSNTTPRVKRLKTSVDGSSHDCITPKTYHQAIVSSTIGGDLAHHECVSKTMERFFYPPT